VNFRDGNETTAYYTDSLENAVNIAVEMARKPSVEQSEAVRQRQFCPTTKRET
jgi:hypothetical protein